MTLEVLSELFSVCQLERLEQGRNLQQPCFLSVTDREISLVCPTDRAPESTLAREDGWRAFRVAGTLNFSLVGILAKLAAVLAQADVSIFAVSTYETDYVLIRQAQWETALDALRKAGYLLKQKAVTCCKESARSLS